MLKFPTLISKVKIHDIKRPVLMLNEDRPFSFATRYKIRQERLLSQADLKHISLRSDPDVTQTTPV
jgi:hypothetical protein